MAENKVTYEMLQKANETIKTTDIKGKDYAQVNQRIKAYRMVYPTGSIITELVSLENGICIFKATVSDEENNILATGTAYEKENSTFINKTSYIENCETSAVGRALGMAGFGIDTSVASAEEVTNAINNQKKDEDERIKYLTQMNELVMNTNTDHEEILKFYKVKSNTEMTTKQLEDCINNLTMKFKKMNMLRESNQEVE